ncbi:hypothetical protein E4U42_001855 [Claviceps africana]|uniref:DUF7779 domain-containing protein n=1 Tax=Claviceps africana TaxID=83212 RepID=A0A8K0JF01_9HYPO|nr:hypothetical protein E4U42_001855 [Claviceps africana]
MRVKRMSSALEGEAEAARIGQEDILEAIYKWLDPKTDASTFKSMALLAWAASEKLRSLSITSISFCSVGDAAEELIRSALITRARRSPTYSVHRLMQWSSRKGMNEAETAKYFDARLCTCSAGDFLITIDIGHQIAA